MMSATPLKMTLHVRGRDFQAGGDGAARIKKVLQQVGFPPGIVRRASIAAYEAEMNIVIHAFEGDIKLTVTPGEISLVSEDTGPGIADIDLAMQEGYSTAPPEVREMGFGAGMGLPNIRRCTDKLEISSTVGQGTTLRMLIYNN